LVASNHNLRSQSRRAGLLEANSARMHPYLIVVARLMLGAMWIVASVAKLIQGTPMAEIVKRFGVRPAWLTTGLGAAMAYIELALGTMLVLGQWTAVVAKLSIILLLAFTIVVSVNLLRNNRLRCNCFGQIGSGHISWWTAVRNLALLGVAAIVVTHPSGYLALDGFTGLLPASGPPVRDIVPVLWMFIAAVLLCFLIASTWRTARALAQAEDGPPLRLAEHKTLQRWLGVRRAKPLMEGEN
jgi:uncharacterized membrane protein YphA (DoxX/SURF4 family)